MSKTFGSLFAGIGGFDLGFERAGLQCKWQVEREPKCQKILSQYWSDVLRIDDVNKLRALTEPRNAKRTTQSVPSIDLICGGFPCQDVSVAGRRAGLAGSRSGLWFTFRRIIGVLRPTWVVIENVPGLLSSNQGRDFGTVVGSLGKLGYGYAWRVLDAQYFGLAQRRKRVFIVGCLGDHRRAAEVLFEPESVRGDSPPSRSKGARVAGTIAARTSAGGGLGTDFETDGGLVAFGGGNTSGSVSVATACTAKPGRRDDFDSETFIAHTLRPEGYDASEDGTGRGTPIVTQERMESLNHNEARTKPQSVAGHGVRRLTPTECERLQGFPDGWTAGLSDAARYQALGNAVAVPVAEWIGRRIVEST